MEWNSSASWALTDGPALSAFLAMGVRFLPLKGPHAPAVVASFVERSGIRLHFRPVNRQAGSLLLPLKWIDVLKKPVLLMLALCAMIVAPAQALMESHPHELDLADTAT